MQDFSIMAEGNHYDRFIPRRSDQHFPLVEVTATSYRGLEVKENQISVTDLFKNRVLAQSSKVLNFHRPKEHQPPMPARPRREIQKAPFKVLDAPNLKQDYYLNLLCWGSNNSLAVALQNSVYTWNGSTGKVSKFCQGDQEVTSLCFNPSSSLLAVGDSTGACQIWDYNKQKQSFRINQHEGRVSSASWSNSLLATGSRDKSICCWDHRSSSVAMRYTGTHSHQVCGLKWAPDEMKLASGGNDNKLFVWSISHSNPVHRFNSHTAAVKAIAWNPRCSQTLASGGGSADRCIRFWNIGTGEQMDHIDTGSQVCNLAFSPNTQQLVSTHGYSNNQIICWRYPSLEKAAVLTGHTSRVLYLAVSPAGDVIATGAGDQTLRFWRLFPGKTQKQSTGQLDFYSNSLR